MILAAILILLLVGYFIVNRSANPYSQWEPEELRSHLLKRTDNEDVKALIRESFESIYFDPIMDFDGCSVVQDPSHPCLACYIHDYLWKSGQGGRRSDKFFYQLNLMEGMSKRKAFLRWLSVRAGWAFYFWWKHLIARNINKFTPCYEQCIKSFKL